MAVSNSTDFSSTAVQLLTDARRLLGVNAEEESLSNSELQIGLRWLTKMLKAWEADGIGQWVLTQGALTLADSTGSYLFGTAGAFTTVPFEITQIRISHDGGNEIEMFRMSRDEYYRLPNKTNEGYPTQWFYDRQRDNGTLYIWPEPDDALYDLTFTYRRRIMDLDSGPNNFDLPPEWEEALTNNLAKRLIPVYGRGGTPEAQQVIADAASSYAIVRMLDTGLEEGSISIEPEDRFGRRSYYRR